MKSMRTLLLCCFASLFAVPVLHAQEDLSKYRTFALGSSLASVLKHTDQRPADVKLLHARPALSQELAWWPSPAAASSRSDAIEQIVFSFHNGELYKLSVSYDRGATEGLTAFDMTKALTAKYGPPTNVALEIDSTPNDRYDATGRAIASWDDSQYSVNLVRSAFTDIFGLVIYSKRVNAEADLATAQAVLLEKQEGPQREAERQQKETADLEIARQKNKKVFEP